MLTGLEAVEKELADYGIPFVVLPGPPEDTLPAFAGEIHAGSVVTDFDPLKIKQHWQRTVAEKLDVPLLEVDGHNVVPARYVSAKQEYAARTIRPKIHKVSHEFLEEFPALAPVKAAVRSFDRTDWSALRAGLDIDSGVSPVDLLPGERAGKDALASFIDNRLTGYAQTRNDPNAEATSAFPPTSTSANSPRNGRHWQWPPRARERTRPHTLRN